jgi:hypothetical protein
MIGFDDAHVRRESSLARIVFFDDQRSPRIAQKKDPGKAGVTSVAGSDISRWQYLVILST